MANRALTIRALCVGAMAFAAVAQAGAVLFSFSYSDLAGDVAVGMINASFCAVPTNPWSRIGRNPDEHGLRRCRGYAACW